MADNTHFYGFRPVRTLSGGSDFPRERRTVATAYQAQDDGSGFSVDLNIGDPVKLVSDGTVALANTTDTVYGVVDGVMPYWDGSRMTPNNKLPGGTAWGTVEARRSEVIIIPAFGVVFECDFDSTSQPTTAAGWRTLIGNNFIHVCPGDQTNKLADPYIDVSSAATTATLEWRLVEFNFQDPQNRDLTGANVKGLFVANLTTLPGAAATPATGV